jgi:hypothetical protein
MPLIYLIDMKKVKIIIIFFLSFVLEVSAAGSLQGVSGTLRAIKKATETAINQSEVLFEQRNGEHLLAPMNIVNDNKYIQVLTIQPDYKIQLQFAGTPPELGGVEDVYIPVARILLGKTIVLIPQFGGYGPMGQPMSLTINSWGCVTNADESAEAFMGNDTNATLGNISLISTNNNNSDNVYLSECVYVSSLDIVDIINTLIEP